MALVEYARDGQVVTLTLNRPEKLNALNLALWKAVGDSVRALSKDDSVRCIVLRGADAGEVGRIVQRCQRNAGFECGDNLIIDAHRVGIMLAAVHHAVADGADAALDVFVARDGDDFLAVATPGAGKTTFALTAARQDLAANAGRRLVVVAPTRITPAFVLQTLFVPDGPVAVATAWLNVKVIVSPVSSRLAVPPLASAVAMNRAQPSRLPAGMACDRALSGDGEVTPRISSM